MINVNDYVRLNIEAGIYLGSLIKSGRRRFNLSAAQFTFMSQLSRYKLQQLERGEAKEIYSGKLSSICSMLDIDFKEALEATDCDAKTMERLIKNRRTS